MNRKNARHLYVLLTIVSLLFSLLPGVAGVPAQATSAVNSRPAAPAIHEVSLSATCGTITVEGFSRPAGDLRVTGTDANGDAVDITETVEEAFSFTYERTNPGTYGPHPVSLEAELLDEGSVIASASYSDELICGEAVYEVSVSATCGAVEVSGQADTGAALRVTGTDANGDAVDIAEAVEGAFSFTYERTNPGTYGPHAVSLEAELLVEGSVIASDSYTDELICGEAVYEVSVGATCGAVEVSGQANAGAELRVTGTDANGDAVDIAEAVEGAFSLTYERTNPGTYGPHAVSLEAELLVEGSSVASDSYSAELICGEPVYGVSISATCGALEVSGEADAGAALRVTGTDANGDAVDIAEAVEGAFSFTYERTNPGTYGPHPVSLEAELLVEGSSVASASYSDELICGEAVYEVSIGATCGAVEVSGQANAGAALRVTGTDANGDAVDITETVEEAFSFTYERTNPGTYGPHAVSLEAELLVEGSSVASDSYSDELICGEGAYEVSIGATCAAVEVSGQANAGAELRVTGTDANGDAVDIAEAVEGAFSFTYERTNPGTYGPHPVSLEAELLVEGSSVASDSYSDLLICGSTGIWGCYEVDVPDVSVPEEGAELTVCASGAGDSARLVNRDTGDQLGAEEKLGADGNVCFTRRFFPDVEYQIQYRREVGRWSTLGCTFVFGDEDHTRGDIYLKKSVVAPCAAIAAMIERYAESDDWALRHVAQVYRLSDLRVVDGEPFDPSCTAYGGPTALVEVWGAAFKAHLTSPDGAVTYLPEFFSADGYDGVAGATLWDDSIGSVFGALAAEFPPLGVGEREIQSPFDWLAENQNAEWAGRVLEGQAMTGHLGLVCPPVQRGAGVYCGWIRNAVSRVDDSVSTSAAPQPSYGRADGGAGPVVNSLAIESHEARDVVQLARWDDLPPNSCFGLSPDGRVIGGHRDDQVGRQDVGTWVAHMAPGDRVGLGAETYVALRKLRLEQTGDLGSDLQKISASLEEGQRALITCGGRWTTQGYTDFVVVVLDPAGSDL